MDALFLVAILHVILIAPFLLWVGFNRAATPDWAYSLLFGLGILIMVYHGYKTIVRLSESSPAVWLNIIHILLIGPLLLWIGYHQKGTERPGYDMLLIAGFGALGFHLYRLVILSQTFVKPTSL